MSAPIPEVPDLFRLAFMPGVFRCPQCDFQLSKQSMCASSGMIGISDSDRETEECPNDGTMMVPVTYREQLAAYESRLFTELDAADALKTRIATLEQDNRQLREQAERLTKPVSDEEWIDLCSGDHVDMADVQRHEIDALIAARTKQ
jgi:hypothetical protein